MNMKTERLYQNKEWLRGKYWDEELSMSKIGELCNRSDATILKWLNKHNILIRSRGESAHIYHKKRLGSENYNNKNWLQKKYLEEKLSTIQIGELCGVTFSTIHKWMIKHNISRRSFSEVNKGRIAWNKGIPRTKEIIEGMSGKNGSNWKGGITPLVRSIRTKSKYRQWRSDVFTRDDFTCQECGQISGRLNAHHIKSFSSILQKYEITTLEEALNCEELWNINNGITFCEECHKLTDYYCNRDNKKKTILIK